MAKLTKIEGVDEKTAQKLRDTGIRTTGALAKQGNTASGRNEIAKTTRIPAETILHWVQQIDLLRVSGVGPEYAVLLLDAGFSDITELGKNEPEHVYRKLARLNQEEHRVRKPPTRYQINDWIKQARRLSASIEY